MDGLTIRPERPEDYRAVEELTRAAFDSPKMLEMSGTDFPLEHYLVHRLRKTDGILELSLVAELGGRIVGHIIYSRAHIERPDGSALEAVIFGPLSVAPELQRKGVGGALMRRSIERARELGYGAIFLFGHPEYYPRFGFVEAESFGVTDRQGKNSPAFMAMELRDGYLKNASGRFIESDCFDDALNAEAARGYDESFRSKGGA